MRDNARAARADLPRQPGGELTPERRAPGRIGDRLAIDSKALRDLALADALQRRSGQPPRSLPGRAQAELPEQGAAPKRAAAFDAVGALVTGLVVDCAQEQRRVGIRDVPEVRGRVAGAQLAGAGDHLAETIVAHRSMIAIRADLGRRR